MTEQLTLTDLQHSLSNGPRPIGEIADNLRMIAEQLVSATSIEGHSEAARNLASAELLIELLRGICQYANARGWNADRLVTHACARASLERVR
jgi:hypothetical protein